MFFDENLLIILFAKIFNYEFIKSREKLYNFSCIIKRKTYINNDGRCHLRGLIFPTIVAGYDGPRHIGVCPNNRIVLRRRRCPVDIISCALTIGPVVVLHSYYIFTVSHHETLYE